MITRHGREASLKIKMFQANDIQSIRSIISSIVPSRSSAVPSLTILRNGAPSIRDTHLRMHATRRMDALMHLHLPSQEQRLTLRECINMSGNRIYQRHEARVTSRREKERKKERERGGGEEREKKQENGEKKTESERLFDRGVFD